MKLFIASQRANLQLRQKLIKASPEAFLMALLETFLIALLETFLIALQRFNLQLRLKLILALLEANYSFVWSFLDSFAWSSS